MLQTLKLNNQKWKKNSFYEEKSLVGLTPGVNYNGDKGLSFNKSLKKSKFSY
jgi:hypothetical protein